MSLFDPDYKEPKFSNSDFEGTVEDCVQTEADGWWCGDVPKPRAPRNIAKKLTTEIEIDGPNNQFEIEIPPPEYSIVHEKNRLDFNDRYIMFRKFY